MPERRPSASRPLQRTRLLLVEPNRSALNVMARRLGEAGYQIVACDQPTNAIAEMHRGTIDLVVAEIRMNLVSGVRLTRMVRDDTVLRDTPIILITGRSDDAGAIEGFEAGADDVVAKPFHFEVLEARIARLLARARGFEQLRHDNAALDARVVRRAIELGEARADLERLEAERSRLQRLVGRT